MKIVEYVAAFYETREPARADVKTLDQMLSLPWVAKHMVNRGFVRFSIANNDTLMMEFNDRGRRSFKVIARISEPDPKVLAELPIWQA